MQSCLPSAPWLSLCLLCVDPREPSWRACPGLLKTQPAAWGLLVQQPHLQSLGCLVHVSEHSQPEGKSNGCATIRSRCMLQALLTFDIGISSQSARSL